LLIAMAGETQTLSTNSIISSRISLYAPSKHLSQRDDSSKGTMNEKSTFTADRIEFSGSVFPAGFSQNLRKHTP
jgi:hypothetical protein